MVVVTYGEQLIEGFDRLDYMIDGRIANGR